MRYVCPNGCCTVIVAKSVHKRGRLSGSIVTINDVVGTFASHAPSYSRTAEALRERVSDQRCLVHMARRPPKSFGREPVPETFELANRFLRMPLRV
jgi:hypothetical protein